MPELAAISQPSANVEVPDKPSNSIESASDNTETPSKNSETPSNKKEAPVMTATTEGSAQKAEAAPPAAVKTVKDDERYSKYFKMLKMGVPLQVCYGLPINYIFTLMISGC